MQDFLENTQPRSFALMLIGIVVLACAIPVTYLLMPQLKSYQAGYVEYRLLDQSTNNSKNLSQQLSRVDEEIKALSRQLHGDMARLPAKQMESFIIGRLQKVSWKTQIELLGVKPGEGKQVQNFRETLFKVSLMAEFHNFFKWLQMVNDELGYIVVNDFEISPNSNESSSDPKLEISLTLISYRMITNAL